MWIAKVKGEWYEVKDVVDQGPGKGNHYDLLGLGMVPQEEIEDLDIKASSEIVQKSISSARRMIRTAEDKLPEDKTPDAKSEFDLPKARGASPNYWRNLGLEKYKNQIQKILKTQAAPNTDDFYQAVYGYQMSNSGITLKDGILGPETLGAMIKEDTSLAKEFQVSQSKNFEEFLSKNEQLAQAGDSNFSLESFKNKIGRVESGGRYEAVSRHSTATGKYQFIWSIWQKPISQFAGRAVSREEFLGSPRLQEDFMDFYTKTNLVPAANNLKKRFPQVTSKLTFEQILGLIHFKGPGDAAKILAGLPDPTSKNNASVPQYLAKLV